MWSLIAFLLLSVLLWELVCIRVAAWGARRPTRLLTMRRERARQRFIDEMQMRWGDPTVVWLYDERARTRDIRLRREHNSRP
jgi:hypothetical protein